MEPLRLIGPAVYADDHRGRYAGRRKVGAPVRDQLAVTGKHDGLGRDGSARRSRDPVIGIALGDRRITEGLAVFHDGGFVVDRIGIYETEANAARRELLVQALDFRRVAV